jgi:hypothetical protein
MNPVRSSDHGLSIGHKVSHSQLEVRLSDGRGTSVESVVMPHARAPVDAASNRTVRVARSGSGRVLDVWLNGTLVGTKALPNLSGDLYTGGAGVVFGDVWGWGFQGTLHSVTLHALDPSDAVDGGGDAGRVDMDSSNGGAGDQDVSSDTDSDSDSDTPTTSTSSSSAATANLWYHSDFTNATGHFAVVPDAAELARVGGAFASKSVPQGGPPLGPLEVIPHSEDLGKVINGRGFVLSVVSTPNGNGGKSGRSLSQCPLRLSDNPRAATDFGFSIGHHASEKDLEIRMADGTALGVAKIAHRPQNWTARCNRTLRVTRVRDDDDNDGEEVDDDDDDEQGGGRKVELWLDDVYMGHALFPGVWRDLYDTRKGGVLGDVWGWGFSGTLHSVSLSPVDPRDLDSGGKTRAELEAMFADEDDDDEEDFARAGDFERDDWDEDAALLDQDMDDLEEFVFASPADVQGAWQGHLQELKHFAQDAERRGDTEALQGLPDACKWGHQSCMHDKEGPLYKKAEAEARVRRTVQDKRTGGQLISALLPSLAAPDVQIGLLPQFAAAAAAAAAADGVGGAGDGVAAEGGSSGGGGDGSGSGSGSDTSDPPDPSGKRVIRVGSGGGGALTALQALQQSVAVAGAVSSGTIVNVGALTANLTQTAERAEASRDRKHSRRYGRDQMDVAWQLATDMAEEKARRNLTELARKSSAAMRREKKKKKRRSKRGGGDGDGGDDDDEASGSNATSSARSVVDELFPFPNDEDKELFAWFEAGGGRLSFVDVRPQGRFRQHRALLADEDLAAGDEVASVPFKLTLNRITMRNVGLKCKGKCSFLSEHFGPIFDKDEEWGLAVLLLHEHAKGNESRWWPFLRSLKMHVLAKKVVKELDGTYALERDRFYGESAEAVLDFVNKDLCRMHNPEACNFGKTRKDMRWALGVVRRFSFNLTKSTSGRPFLSLVPYGNLLRHRDNAGGSCVLGLDNVVRFRVGEAHPMGTPLTIR